MKRRAESVVLALHSYRSRIWCAQCAGMRRYCQPHGWEVRDFLFPRRPDFGRIRRMLDSENVVGIVTSLPVPLPDDIRSRQPVVCFDCEESGRMEGCPFISHDAACTAHLAVCELASLSRRNFAYAHASSALYWSQARCDAFEREAAARSGFVAPSFSMPGVRDGRRLVPAMARWVAGLPKPCGVFAANDETAALLLRACRMASGVRVPEDVAVVGVDDNWSICDSTSPTLSSVAPDWESGAFLVAATLWRMSKGRQVDMEGTFRPLGLIRRGSTASASGAVSKLVVKAVGAIRARACEGIMAKDVVKVMGCSRRLAELRFREVTGRSILEEIRRTRYENARRLLSQTGMSVGAAANMSGWSSVPTFCRDFKADSGMTPMDWRRKNRK